MQIGIILVVALYEIITIGGVGWLLNKKKSTAGEQDFALGGRSLGTWAVGTTMCLTLLGSGHLTGTWEGALTLGGAQIWHVMANGFAMSLGAPYAHHYHWRYPDHAVRREARIDCCGSQYRGGLGGYFV